ncbi:unnamed protein product [Cuscuta campestris]|uniref:DUF4216 domain-containing protein n=1 Tax=Cuscuta campestris TaxID=132261 RepID=A0A484L1B6_9ASTE|nr:unnamed protein product [Cuscuta campestris]
MWPIYFVNGYCFHTVKHGSKRAMYNSGVSIKGAYGDYFGVLEEILEIEYPALPLKRCVLFKCRWFDPRLNRGTRVHKKYGLLEVLKKGEFNRYEPFIFGAQANQVVCVEYPCTQKTKSDWIAVCQVHPRGNWIDIENTLESVDKEQQEPFQANGTERTTIMEVTQDDEIITLSHEGDANFTDDDSDAEEEDEEPILSSDDSIEEEQDSTESEVGESTEDQEDGGGDDHDFEDHVDDGHSGGARDGEGPGHQRQFVYVNSDDEVTNTSAGAGLITPAFYERTDTTGMSWGKVSATTKEFYYREFKKNARVDPSIDEGRLRKAFLKKAAERYANFTYNQRNPGRLKKKKKMDPRPFEQLKKAKKKGGHVSVDEVIIHTKTKKHDGKTWVDPEHAELQAQFFELREEATQNVLQVTDEEIWYSLVEGHNAENRVP